MGCENPGVSGSKVRSLSHCLQTATFLQFYQPRFIDIEFKAHGLVDFFRGLA